MSAYSNPSVADFKERFDRDFPYGTDMETSVRDVDITRAYTLTNINFNPGFFGDQTSYTEGYLQLAAHYLVTNLRASSQGMNGQYAWLEAGKGVGSVNESFQIPQRILDNPEFAMLSKTNYGAQFLLLIMPQLSGQIFAVAGRTHA